MTPVEERCSLFVVRCPLFVGLHSSLVTHWSFRKSDVPGHTASSLSNFFLPMPPIPLIPFQIPLIPFPFFP